MPIPPPKVTTRDISWLDLAERAWGSEFRAPDHRIYQFTGRNYDSTDRGLTGLYGVVGDNSIILDGERYPDMRDGFNRDFGPGQPNGSLNLPFGSFDELVPDTVFIPSGLPAPLAPYDPYYANVALLIHGDNGFVDAGPLATPLTGGAGQILTNSSIPPAFLGNQLCFYQAGVGSNFTIGNTGAAWPGIAQATLEPYTLEMALYCVAYPASNASILGAQLTSRFWQITSAGQLNVGSWQGQTMNNIIGGPIPLNQWVQVAVTYDGSNGANSIKGFLNGQLKTTSSGGTTISAADNFSMFELPGANGATGPIFRGGRKELRYTKGIQRYGANYTPATGPFPNVGPPP